MGDIIVSSRSEEIKFHIERFAGLAKGIERTEDERNRYIEELTKLEKFIDFYENKKELTDSPQYKQVLNDLIFSIYNGVRVEYLDIENLEEYNYKFSKMEILDKLSFGEKNVILIGANGAGKSSFVSSLKQALIYSMVVLPAQKTLLFHSNMDNNKSVKDVEAYQNVDLYASVKNEDTHIYQNDYQQSFSVLITAIANDYIYHGMKRIESDKDALEENQIIFNKLRETWKILLPHIELKVDTTLRRINPVTNGKEYHMNSLSDGERCILYFMGNILMAPQNSYIIVDEPETYLNPSVYNKLWDLLIQKRPDCKFIFCSHTVDFITARTNTTLVWNKKFIYPNQWDYEFVPDSNDLPTSVLAELLGSRKRVLFCEGDDKSSYDFKIYSSLFMDIYTVIPAGGHTTVIQYVKAFNELNSLHHNSAVGIIDGDLLSEEQIESYKRSNIFTLPFNEVEMLLFTEEVMNSSLSSSFDSIKVSEKISNFKAEFFKSIKNKKEKIVLAKIKKHIDYELSNYRIQHTNSLSELTNEYKKLNETIDIENEYANISRDIDNFLDRNLYGELLNLCNLKEEVSKGLANRHLDSDYADKAIFKISSNSDLKDLIKEKYFEDISI